MEGQKRILLVSRDLVVLQTRKLMLGAYFEVCAAGRAVEAKILLSKQPFDLMVLCYTLSGEEFDKTVAAARVHCPAIKILLLTVDGNAACKDVAEFYYLPAERGPFMLVRKSAELLGFEFRSKGRMVRAPQPGLTGGPGTAIVPNAT